MWKYNLLFLMVACCCLSCEQNRFDLKPRSSLVVPTSAADYQALLNNTGIMNVIPAIGELGTSDYFLDDAFWLSLSESQRNLYTWGADVFGAASNVDWNSAYQSVLYANTVLDGIPNDPFICAQALFYRAHAFYQLSQLFAPTYASESAASSPGIPLRLTAVIDEGSFRSSLATTYIQITTDLLKSIPHLEKQVPYLTRPSKAAAYALLARTYLQMSDYQNAYKYADSCLQLQSTLINYNMLDQQASFPFSRFNAEVLFHATLYNYTLINPTNARVTNEVYQLYEHDDLRKNLFFKTNTNGSLAFRGNYDGEINPLFGGITTAEMYLVRAECLTRQGQIDEALSDLNLILSHRINRANFQPLGITEPSTLLSLILKERRRELLFRGLRWTDLRRLNQQSATAQTLTRQVNGQAYQLEPGSLRYTYPIPPDVMALNPDMPQNNR